jgi:hypothetical protein
MASRDRIYYTYAYLRKNGTPYYIGKGCGTRWRTRRGRTVKPPFDVNRILILKRGLTESEAFKHEKYMISVFGRKDLNTGILHNRTNGGEGCSGTVYSDESREQMSRKRKLRVTKQSTRDKMSLSRTGKTVSLQTRQRLSEALRGRVRKPQHCEALSIARTKDWQNPDYRNKIIEGIKQYWKDKTLSEQEVQQRVEACKGKKWYWNPETGHTIRINPLDLAPPGYIPGRKTFKRIKK